jgi:phenylacetate-coenzyme A ligase PaaK-like adenylate-forming protein
MSFMRNGIKRYGYYRKINEQYRISTCGAIFSNAMLVYSIADARLNTHRQPNLNQQQIREKLKTLLETTKSVNFWKEHYRLVDLDAALAKPNIHEILESLPITYKSQYIQNFPENVITTVREAEHQTLSSGGTNELMTVMTDFAKRDSLRALENVNVSLSQNAKCAKKTLDIPPLSL